jgi:hypothetical protein
VSDEPAFPPPPPRAARSPSPAAQNPPRRTKPLIDDLVDPVERAASSTHPDRRWGCVIPLAVLGLALTVGGASIVLDWWTKGGTISIYLLVLCVLGGPGLLWFARKVYRDPSL